jgi:hypothetical protein
LLFQLGSKIIEVSPMPRLVLLALFASLTPGLARHFSHESGAHRSHRAAATYHTVHRAAIGPHEGVLPLSGNVLPLAIFYTTVQIGNPPRTFNVSVDTGSTDMLVPLAGCNG